MFIEGFLSSLFDVVLQRLASSNFIDYFHRVKLDILVEKLDPTLNSINQVLNDAEKKQYENTNVKKWLSDVKHALYEADQLLDEISTNASLKKLKVESQPTTSNNIFSYISAFINPFESRIKELLKNLESLVEQKDRLELKNGTSACNEVGVSLKPLERMPTSYLVDESGIYGRDDDKDKMIKILLSNNGSGNQTPVISIVGLGGMGKTTFAKLVYNDNKIEKHFELKAWVYVSEYFDVVGLTKAILKSFNSPDDDESILNLLQQRLQHRLTCKKYLLVLDDIWNRNEESWEQLLLPFNHGSFGSKIIVTTRDKEITSIMKSTQLLHLEKLGQSDCWSLFVRHAFHGTNVCEYPNLESIGKKIVVKCGELPLAVKTLGNLLRKKFTQREWLKILETDIWRLSDGNDKINLVLRLSYHNLPTNLKRCFAYCSIFPKGYVFDKDELIKLWMAEGLLKCCTRDKSEEELGSELFNDLESISFFQQSVNPLYSGVLMHDLVNDLAKSVSGEFSLLIEGDIVKTIPKMTRHIYCSVESKDDRNILDHVYKIEGLRSLMVHPQNMQVMKKLFSFVQKDLRPIYKFNFVQHELYSRLKYLRMLSFNCCDLSELANEISNLKLLRYLDLTRTGIKCLPDSICMLFNLQTLILRGCPLNELPSDFHKLTNLRHLDLEGTDLKKMPKQIGRLHHLQTLTHFVVGNKTGSDIKELAKLNHLQGKLCISGLENVINLADAAKANLKDKKHLEKLILQSSYLNSREEMEIYEVLQPHSNLNSLIMEDYHGSNFPNWLRAFHLPNLVSLQLKNCGKCYRLPPLGQLPSLKELTMSGCDGIMTIGEEFYGNNSSNVPFRSLEVLLFDSMNGWEEWLCLKEFPLLKELCISYCLKLKSSLPQHLTSLQKLVISNCENLEASIPTSANIRVLELHQCDSILINEFPSSLKRFVLRGNRFTKFFDHQNLFNNVILEELDLDFSGFIEFPSLYLRCYNSLRTLYIRGWGLSTLPFALNLFTSLSSLKLFDCLQLESFPKGGLPYNLGCLEIYNCPKLIASRKEWGLFQLNSLKSFTISDEFENTESFPEKSLLPPTLETLCLYKCSKLRIMNGNGFLHLKSLQTLDIGCCPSFELLSEKGMPNSLTNLYIHNCPLLYRSYQKKEGELWHTVRHIPSIMIDLIQIQK